MKFIFILLSLFAAGCSGSLFKLSPEQTLELSNSAPVCRDPKVCEIMWARAQLWITRNSDLKIQVNTDNVLETYNPNPNRSMGEIGARVTKEPMLDGSYVFNLETFCGTVIGCPNKYNLHKSFNEDLKRGTN